MRPLRVRQVAFITTITLALSFAPLAGSQSSALTPEKKAGLEQAVTSFLTANKVPGISVAAVVDGRIAFAEAFGMADLEKKVPATTQTLFRLASVSKPLTATGAMQLWEHGKLDLDAPIQKYCPQFPEKPSPITTRELLGHLGGVRHYKSDAADDLEGGNVRHFDDPISGGIQFFANDPLVEVPGAKFHYSTQGYTLVGCAIQSASGEAYTAYMIQNVFTPAGMSHTLVDDRTAIIPNRTSFYSKNKAGEVFNADPLDSSYKIPGGGWISTAEDIANFEIAMLDDKLVKRSTRDLMWTAQKQTDGTLDHYGLGFGIATVNGVEVIAHSGSQQGTSTNLAIIPSKQAAIAVLINMDGIDASGLSHTLMKILLAPAVVPAAH